MNEEAERWMSLVPPPKWAYRYHHRIVHGVEDFAVFDRALAHQWNVLMEGPTGSSKTTVVQAWASAREKPLSVIQCHTAAEPGEWLGSWHPTPEGSFDFAPQDSLLVLRYGGVLVLDEIDRALPGVAAFLHSILDYRRLVSVPMAAGSQWPTSFPVHEDTLIVAAHNRGMLGHDELDEALRNRFPVKVEWGYDTEVEAKLLTSKSLITMAEKVRHQVALGDLSANVSTNQLVEFEAMCRTYGWRFAVANLVTAWPTSERQAVTEALGLVEDQIMDELYTLDPEVA